MSRAIAVLLVGSLATAGLAGCRSEPSVAVYLGDRPVSVAEVDRIAGSAPDATPARVVSLLVCGAAGRRTAAERKLEVGPPAPEKFAALFGRPADSDYVRLWAECFALIDAAGNVEMARPLTPDESRRLVEAAAAAEPDREFDLDASIAQARSLVHLGPMFEAQRHFAAAVIPAGIVINPRYDRPAFPVVVDSQPMFIAYPDGSVTP